MSKNYANYVSSNSEAVPDQEAQTGQWNITEQYRQKGQLGVWPIITPASSIQAPLGSISYGLSADAVSGATSNGDFLVPSGQGLEQSIFPGLFSAYGYEFGGAGNIFNLPNMTQGRTYLKGTTASGMVASGFFNGQFPEHTHIYNKANGAIPGNGFASGGCKRTAGQGTGSVGNSAGDKVRCLNFGVWPILTCQENQDPPFGVLYSLATPLGENELAVMIADNDLGQRVLVPTGQDVSRTDNAQTFAVLGTLYGAGDGSTTFTLPDLRNAFVECRDPASEPLTGQTSLTPSNYAQHSHQCITFGLASSDGQPDGGCSGEGVANGNTQGPATQGNSPIGTGNETRPSNFSTLWVMRGG